MASEYYILVNNIQKGPFPVEKLKSQGVQPETLVWKKGLQNWVKARQRPDLRHLFPWQPPDQRSASGVGDSAGETHAPSPAKKQGNLAPEIKKQLQHGGRRWWDISDIDPKRRKIGIGVIAALILVPLAIWSVINLRKSNQLPSYRRQKDPEVNPLAKKKPPQPKGQRVARDGPKGPGKVRGRARKKLKGGALPEGRQTEDYYRLARNLSFERLVGGVSLNPRPGNRGPTIVEELRKLAQHARDDVIKRTAREAIDVWTSTRPAGRSVFLNRNTGGVARLEALQQRMAGQGIGADGYKRERKLRELWGGLIRHMQIALDGAGRLTPALAEARIDAPAGNLNATEARLIVKNTSREDLYHVTIQVTLETPWGLKVTNHYYANLWPAGKAWPLSPGNVWGGGGLAQTGVVTLTVWSDAYRLPARRFKIPRRFDAIVDDGLKYVARAVETGRWEVPLGVAQGLAANPDVDEKLRKQARAFVGDFQRIRDGRRAALAATAVGKTYRGRWRFGRFRGDVGLKFVGIDATHPNRLAANPFVNRPRDEGRTPVRAQLYDPRRPPEYKTLDGWIEYAPIEQRFAIVLNAGNSRFGIDGTATRLPDNTKNYLLKNDVRQFRFAVRNGELHGWMTAGDEFVLVPADRKDVRQRIDELKKRPDDFAARRHPGAIEPVPVELLPDIGAEPVHLDWKRGEMLRIDLTEKGRPVRRRTNGRNSSGAVGSPSQVFFSRNGAALYAVLGSETFAWNARTGRLEFRASTGTPVALSPSRRYLAAAGSAGTRIFNGLRGLDDRRKLDKSSTVAAFSPDGRIIVTADRDGRVDAFRINGEKFFSGRHSSAVTAAGVSPDGKLLFSASADRKVSIWDLSRGGKYVGGYGGGEFEVLQMDVSPDSSRVLMISRVPSSAVVPQGPRTPVRRAVGARGQGRIAQYELQIWDVEGRKRLYSARIGRQATCIAVSHDWRRALVGEQDGPVSVWDLLSGVETHRLVGHTQPAAAVAFSADGRFAVSAGRDNFVILWGLPRLQGRTVEPTLPPGPLAGNKAPILAPPKPVPERVRKRRMALAKLRLAEAAAKSGRRLRASSFLEQAEKIAGSDPIVVRELKRIRRLLGTGS